MRIALFATCLGDHFFPEAVADCVRLLRFLGVEVVFPKGQSCCGQPAFNAGHIEEARRAARRTLEAFESFEYVVLPSGSCAAMLRYHLPSLLDGRGPGAKADRHGGGPSSASQLASRTYELSEFLVGVLGVEELGEGLDGLRVCYHHGCHALRTLGIRDEPLGLLRRAGAEIVGWEAEEDCCGFGGVFSVKVPSVSAAMADWKLDTLPRVDLVTSTDGGCLLQLSGRATKRGLDLSFRHLASVLWQATSTVRGGAP